MALPKTVKLDTNLNTYAEPAFIVKDKNGRLYLAVALLEYDKVKANGKQEMEEGVQLIQDFFEDADKLEACEFKSQGTLPDQTWSTRARNRCRCPSDPAAAAGNRASLASLANRDSRDSPASPVNRLHPRRLLPSRRRRQSRPACRPSRPACKPVREG